MASIQKFKRTKEQDNKVPGGRFRLEVRDSFIQGQPSIIGRRTLDPKTAQRMPANDEFASSFQDAELFPTQSKAHQILSQPIGIIRRAPFVA